MRRKRLRRLRRWLFGKPRLVIPSVVVGSHRALRSRRAPSDATEDNFLWGAEWTRDHPRLRGNPPSDAEWIEQYKAYRDGHVTYDATTARKRLLRLTHQDKFARPTVFSVEESPPLINKASTKNTTRLDQGH